MAAIFYLLGWSSKKDTSTQPTPLRKRLQRKSWGRKSTSDGPPKLHIDLHNSCLKLDEILDVGTCIDAEKVPCDLVFRSVDELTLVGDAQLTPQELLVPFLLHKNSIISNYTASFYSTDELHHAASELTGRRAKTPVFMIGQLERLPERRWEDQAQLWADDYQSTLPPRARTPAPAPAPSTPTSRKVRKVRCQASLRDLVKAESDLDSPQSIATDRSPGEKTLVGSEPASPDTPAPRSSTTRQSRQSDNWSHSQSGPLFLDEWTHSQSDLFPSRPSSTTAAAANTNTDIGLSICTDLLTNELATSFAQHRDPTSGRASELQILLMIEAYELMLKQLQERAGVRGGEEGEGEALEQVLDHWLGVLYGVYDRSLEKVRHEEIMAASCQSPVGMRSLRSERVA